MTSICKQTGYTTLVSVNISPFPSLVYAIVFNNNLIFSNLLPNSCPWFLWRLTGFCLKSNMNLAKDSRTVAAVHYCRYQEFLSLVKSRIKKLKEKEVVCCSNEKRKRLCSWVWSFYGYVEAVGLWTPISAAWISTCAPNFMTWCLFPVHTEPVPMLQSVLLQLSWYTFHFKKKKKKAIEIISGVLCSGKC